MFARFMVFVPLRECPLVAESGRSAARLGRLFL
jgi:hypothetical protein